MVLPSEHMCKRCFGSYTVGCVIDLEEMSLCPKCRDTGEFLKEDMIDVWREENGIE